MAKKGTLKPYFLRQNLKVFALYFEPAMYETLKRFAKEDDRSLQKLLQRVIANYVRDRLIRGMTRKED